MTIRWPDSSSLTGTVRRRVVASMILGVASCTVLALEQRHNGELQGASVIVLSRVINLVSAGIFAAMSGWAVRGCLMPTVGVAAAVIRGACCFAAAGLVVFVVWNAETHLNRGGSVPSRGLSHAGPFLGLFLLISTGVSVVFTSLGWLAFRSTRSEMSTSTGRSLSARG
jgi:hypothetical protein